MSLDLSWTKCHYLLEEKKTFFSLDIVSWFPWNRESLCSLLWSQKYVYNSTFTIIFRIIQLRDKLLEYILTISFLKILFWFEIQNFSVHWQRFYQIFEKWFNEEANLFRFHRKNRCTSFKGFFLLNYSQWYNNCFFKSLVFYLLLSSSWWVVMT
jgi:hypothetical protein